MTLRSVCLRTARQAPVACGVRLSSLLLAGAIAVWVPALAAAQLTTTRVSVDTAGTQGNAQSRDAAISGDGRWVAFASEASNLVANDTNYQQDVFLHDRLTGATTRVSVRSGGAQANLDSAQPAISADGRWVAFRSRATNLVTDDGNGVDDVFVHDCLTGTTTRVSVGPDAQANGASYAPAISADGRWVAFESWASNLVPDDTNGWADVFVYDRQTGTTMRVSTATGGGEGNHFSSAPSISGDGRWVAFHSFASNLVAGDTNEAPDVFVHDGMTGLTTRASVGPGGAQGNSSSLAPAMSADGRWVAFTSSATNLVAGDTNGWSDVFVYDRLTGTTTRVSLGPGGAEGSGYSIDPAISADGRWVAFDSAASNFVADDTNGVRDLFVRDRLTGTTTRVSLGPVAAQGNAESTGAAISADGRAIAFFSPATTFVVDDTNGWSDVFVHDRSERPLPPEGLVAYAVRGNQVTLHWTIPSIGPPPTNFLLEGGMSPNEVLDRIPTGSAAPIFSFTAPSGSYYVRLHALNGVVRSTASNEIRLHVNVLVSPSAPASLLGLANGSSLALAWRNTYEGGAPTSLVLDVSGSIVASFPLPLTDAFGEPAVPPGTYTIALRAVNAGGSSPASNPVTLTFPRPCSGPPGMPTDVVAYRVGSTVFVRWGPATSGPAPTSYLLNVTGAWVGSLPTTARELSGTVASGAYTLSVVAANWCGTSVGTAPQTVVVP